MLPIVLDVAHLPVLLVGAGPLALRRLGLLDAAGAGAVRVFCPDPSDTALAEAAGARLSPGLPDAGEIAAARLLLVAGLAPETGAALAALARAAGVLVNVEDDRPGCDFHMPAIHRQGDLLIAISTGGASPALAQRVRAWIAGQFGAAWADRLARAAALRAELRGQGADGQAVAAAVRALAAREHWLDEGEPG